MEEQTKQIPEPNVSPVPPAYIYQPPAYTPPPRYVFPLGKRELVFAAGILLSSMLLCNGLLYGGANLAFAAGLTGIQLSTFFYLRSHGHRGGRYTGILLILSLAITAAFPRSADGAMKFFMVCILLTVPSLAFCLMAGQNRQDSAGIASLLDAPRAMFAFGMGRMAESGRGIREACKSTGTVGKKGGAVALGLVIAIPLLAILVPLLMSADAAFEGLLDLMPEFRWEEWLTTALLGGSVGYVLYTRGAALQHLPKSDTAVKNRKGLNALTVNTVLIAVAAVYLAYLVSQLAYLVGGFSGILPAEFTLAEYARRGFFEMGWLCAINLTLIALAVGLVSAREKAPLLTRILCLFLGAVTLFLVATASAKMLLYIGSYGLTRLRVLTEVFMIWLALTTVVVCIWLFRPKLPYMKLVLVVGLVFCAALMWADVDTQVARYNVRAYQSGKLETVDVLYLGDLNDAAVPYLAELAQDDDPAVAKKAEYLLKHWYARNPDLRSWNYAQARAAEILENYASNEKAEAAETIVEE